MNDHLKVKELSPEEMAASVPYMDAFFINTDNETVTWIYYNPDSVAGGQYVTNTLNFDEISVAAKRYDTPDEFFVYLGSIANQTLADVGTDWLAEAESQFLQQPDLMDCTPETMKSLINLVVPDLATRLTMFMKDYDFYDYQDSMEIGETDVDMFEKVRDILRNPDEVSKVLDTLDEIDREDLTPEQQDELRALMIELQNYEHKVPVYDRESEILYDVLSRLKIDDITLDFDENGLVARDNDNEWHGAEFYHFLIDEAFVFNMTVVLN